MAFWFILAATVLVSLISLVGVFFIGKGKSFDAKLIPFVSFSAGAMLAAAFIDLLPEAIEQASASTVLPFALIAILVFFAMEKMILWHHHHSAEHETRPKPMGYLNLVGDGLHNLFDGVAIAAAFITSVPLGIATTLAVIAHELPQEIGDYSLLVYSGFERNKALLFNLLCGLTAVAGALLFYVAAPFIENSIAYLLAFAAGMFIYIAVGDVIPVLHKEERPNKSLVNFLCVLAGVLVVSSIVIFLE